MNKTNIMRAIKIICSSFIICDVIKVWAFGENYEPIATTMAMITLIMFLITDELHVWSARILRETLKIVMTERHEYYQDMVRHLNALYTIKAQETPKANATVKRMAKIAREALTEPQ